GDRFLVGKVVDVLQIMQPDHQPRRFRGPTNRSVEAAKRLIEPGPVDDLSKLHQRMFHVDHRVKAVAEKVMLATRWTDWTHRKTPEIEQSARSFLQFAILQTPWESLKTMELPGFSGRTN